MKKYYIIIVLLFANLFMFSQNNGIKSFELPAQNSLKFNKFLINPTFSFVKEEDPYLSIFNKRQWAGFENAPLTYSANYSTKFEDNNALSIGVFLQDYSIISSQGVILNYARNVQFDDDSNLTFGLNLSAFKSGINTSKIITNSPDPLLDGFKSSTIVALNPGINYGTDIIDFGISAKNLFQYDFSLSQNVALDPLKSLQGHFMYTGYIESSDIFDGSKFITLVRAEKQRENMVLSGNLLLDIPKLGWVQGGYNNIDGIAAGLGFNITRNISFGYNFEKGLGDASKLGFTHEFLLAYYFKEFEESSDGGPIYVTKPIVVTPVVKIDNEKIAAEEKARADAEAKFLADKQKATEAKLKAIADAKAKAEEDAIALAEKQKLNAIANAEKAKAAADAKILSDKQKIADAKAKAISDAAKAKIDAIAQAKEDAEAAKIKAIEDAKSLALKQKAEADAAKLKGAEAAKLLADAKAKALKEKAASDAAKALELAATNKAKADAAKLLADEQKATADAAKAEAAANAKILADKQKAEADAAKLKGAEAAKLLADAKAKALKEKVASDAAKALELAATNKAKADAAKLLADEQKATADAAKAEAAANAKILADKQKAEADAAKLKGAEAAKLLADAKAKALKEKVASDAAKALELAAINKAKADAAKLLAEEQKATADAAKAEAAANAKILADKQKAEAEAAKLKGAEAAKLLADAKAKALKEKAASDEAKALELAAINKAKAEVAKLLADEQKAKADAAKAEAAANAKILADKQKAEANAAKLKALETAKLLAEAKAKADKDKSDELAAKNKAIADAAKAKEEAAAKLISDAAKAKADAASKLAAAAAAKADKEKADADAAKAKAQADAAKAKAEQDAKNIADANKSETDKSLDYVKKILDDATKNSKGLLSKLESTVLNKEKDLKDLKEENDLGDKGIIKTPKPFQSASEANKALETLKNELSESTKQQAGFITQYEDLLTERQKKVPNKADPVNVSYIAAIDKLKAEQLKTEQLKSNLITKLDKIKTDIDIEKKRRIKRAAFESGQSRYDKDRAALKIIKETTVQSKTALTSDDFDFGTDDQSNMQILKKIENTQPGFYLILAVHTDTAKRDAFLTKMVSSGVINVDFFFDIVSGKYFIYSKKYESIDEASIAIESKGKKPYDAKMFIVKLEN